MIVELAINNSVDAQARFVSWTPSPCRIRMTNASGATGATVNVQISGKPAAGGGSVAFRKGATGPFSNSLSLPLPTNGTAVPFFVDGKFGSPSSNNGDVTIQAAVGGTVVGSVPVMVRVRKNANALAPGERDRFVAAFAQLNNHGAGRFADFRDMHTAVSSPQAHGAPGFLPWHRAYLLDLERLLQAIDPSVSLPYWRFDKPAPNIFTLDFLGVSDPLGTVQFNPANPLRFWVTDGVQGINRRPLFSTSTAPPGLLTEAQTLALGNQYRRFRNLEGNPHGSAHVSFGGAISSIPTAAKDPLFFLLHCNVDRLWAKWQRKLGRFDPVQAASYDSNPGNPVGHNLGDTMWPWNGITGGTRPPTAPGGPMPTSPCFSAPAAKTHVRDCLDYQGTVSAPAALGFDYDDVPFA